MEDAVIEFYKGRTYTMDFEVIGLEEPYDEVFFTVCKNASDKNYVLRKSLENGIKLVLEDGNTTTFNLSIDATDTDKMLTDYEYGFDIMIVSNIKKIQIVTGTLTLKPIHTKTCNE